MNNTDPDQAYGSNDVFGDEMSDAGCSSASDLLERIERSNNEAVILCNVIELCQLLVMGSEETLTGFPTKRSVPCLTNLLRTESNFEITLHACRALQYLIEVLPRSTQVVLEAVPALLEKLQVVECVDVAEQSLQVLDLLSKKHSKVILKQNGIASCLKFIDFFSTSAQRTSLSIVSNCCLVATKDDFHLVRDSLSILSARLLMQDKKSVESVCLCFSRLVENLKNNPDKLEEVSNQNLFRNLQHLLLESPAVASSSTFVVILRMLNILSSASSSLYLHLLRSDIGDTLLQLLIGPLKTSEPPLHFELVSRSAQEIFEIISLISNLLPPPPLGGIFSINSAIFSSTGDDFLECSTTSVVWQWCDGKGVWHSYSGSDSRIIEVAHRMGEPEIGMSLLGRMYTIDFQMMQQINEETGTSRPVQRTLTCSRSQNSAEATRSRISPRRDATQMCREETSALVSSLLPVVYEVFCTTASLAVKHKCLQTLLRMVLHSDAPNLRCILKNVPISSSIAGMLTSYDTRTIVTAVQLCHLLMERLPDVFSVFFQRQGVLHQMLHLAQTGLYDPSNASSSSSSSSKSISYPKEHLQPSDRQKGSHRSDPSPQSSRLVKGDHQPDQNPQRSRPGFGFLPPRPVPSSRYNKSSCQVRFQMSEEMSSSMHDASLLTMSTPAVFHPQGRGSALDDAVTAAAMATAPSPTSLSSPSSPSINATADVEPQRSSLIQVRLADVLRSKKSNYRLLKEEPSLFRFGPIRTEGGSRAATYQQPSRHDNSSHSVSASPPHHHSTPSVYMPSKNLGTLVSQRIASISSAASSSSSSSSAVQCPSSHRNNNNSNHFCNGNKSGRMDSPPSTRQQQNQQQNQQQAQQSSAAPVSNSYVSATKARLFGNKEQQLTSGSKSSSLTFPRSLLASLNPKKWAKFSTPLNQKSIGKESSQNKPSEPLQKKAANSKEVINAWVVQNASLFMDKYFNRPVQSYSHPSLNILSQLSSTLLNLGNILTDEEQLRCLSQLLSNNDISPFELIQSSFIDLMTSYLTSDNATLKFERLRIFLHVFLDCPKTEYMSMEDIWSSAFGSSHSPIHHLVTKLLNCFHHLEKFQLKTSDHSSAFRTSLASDPNTYRFYKADLVKCSLQLHPSCSGSTNHWNVGLVRIDPFAIVQSLESILTQTIKIADSDLSEDEDDFEEQTNMEATEHEGYHSMSSSSSSSSLTSPTPAQSKGFEFHVGNNLVPEGMTVFQAIKRFSVDKKSQNEPAAADGSFVHLGSSPALNREHHIWSAEHTIWFKPKGLTPANSTEAPSTSKSTPIVIHPRKAKFEPSITIHQHNIQLHRHRHFQQSHLHHQHQHQHQHHYGRHHHRNGRQSQSSRQRHNYQHLHLQFEVPSFRGHRNSTSSSASSSSSSSSSSRGNGSSSSIGASLKLNLTTLQQQHITLNDPSIPVLSLLRIVHSIVTNWHLLYRVLNWSDVDFADKKVVNMCDFISNKLTSKLMKQLQDPIVLLSGSLPLWVSHVPIICPFLLSFQTRHHLFCLTCLDKGRALLKFNERTSEPSSSSASAGDGHHNSSGRINCRVERVKKVIKRRKILEQAEHVMSDMVGSSAILEIKYEEEIGFGLGPTLEFYALVSQKVQRSDLNMWISCEGHFTFAEESEDFKDSLSEFPAEVGPRSPRVEGHPAEVGHVVPPSPFLHPLPLPDDVNEEKLRTVLDRFEFLGRFMAKSLVDSRLVDLPLSPMFYKWLLGEEHLADLSDLRHVDVGLYGSLMKLQSVINNKKVIENSSHLSSEEKREQIKKLTLDGMTLNDLCLTFTLPGHENFELLPSGSNEPVTIDNLEQYIELVVHWMLVRGIYRQMAAFKLGFETFLPLSSLQFFYANELDRLFCGSHRKEDWTVEYLSEACRPDHGYAPDSPAVRLLYAVLSSFDRQQQRMFIQFVTGSPRLPVGGLKSLTPPLTIVRKTTEHGLNPDDFLPSVMTCVNYLKLPDYSTLEVMKRKLDMAVTEGRLSFHLS